MNDLEPLIKSDTDGLYYRSSDLEWIVEPSDTDPGILTPRIGAKGFETKQGEQCTQ
jgi:hypothetical protein